MAQPGPTPSQHRTCMASRPEQNRNRAAAGVDGRPTRRPAVGAARPYPAPVPIAAPPAPGELPESLTSGPPDAAPVRVGRTGRTVRLAAVVLVFALLGWGSWKADDDAFPVGPFVMFAFTTPPDGEVRSAAVEAVDVTGQRLPVVLEPEEVGLRRAEMEGQIPRA